jgi:cell division protein ZapA
MNVINKSEHALSIQIADKQFTLKCPPEKTEDLKQCAQYVDTQMRAALKNAPNNPGHIERTALMTAINIAHDLLLQKREQESAMATMSHRLETLQNKIENTLRLREIETPIKN